MSSVQKRRAIRLVTSIVHIVMAPVTGAQGTAATSPVPTPDVTITMREYAFDVDSTLSAGHHVLTIRNTRHQGHLMILTRLAQGKTSRNVVSRMEHQTEKSAGDVVVTSDSVKPGDSTIVSVDLSPGRYSLVCTIRGWWNRPHYRSGMTRDIVVQ